MTEAKLKEIEERAAKATPGPWKDLHNEGGYHFVETPGNQAWEVGRGDAEFIAHARTDIPELVAEVRKLREALEFYADKNLGEDSNFYILESLGGSIEDIQEIHDDGESYTIGTKARAALGEKK